MTQNRTWRLVYPNGEESIMNYDPIKAEKNLVKKEILEYIDLRVKQLNKNRKDLPKHTRPERREVAIRQTQGRILELASIKQVIRRNKICDVFENTSESQGGKN